MQKSLIRAAVGALAVTVTVAGGSAVGLATTTASAAAPAATQPTAYAMSAYGYGTQAVGSGVPVNSGQTAFQALACTNRAGIDKTNTQAYQEVPGVGVARGATTRVWTTRTSTAGRAPVVSSWGRHTLESLTLNRGVGVLRIQGIQSTSRAWRDDSGYRSATSTSVGTITFTPAGGEPETLATPTASQPVDVPGVATLTVGSRFRTTSPTGARAGADALTITLAGTGTRARIARSTATIDGGVRSGIFSGFGLGSQGRGVRDTTRSGPTPLQLMPCQGTRGIVNTKSVTGVDLGGGVLLQGLSTSQWARQDPSEAQGWQTGRVNNASVNGDALVVRDVRGRANVLRTDNGVARNINGTQVGEITTNGERRTIPASGVLVIPGVARLERSLVTRSTNGISVIALRLTLLDGSGAVVDLGKATLKIAGSGL